MLGGWAVIPAACTAHCFLSSRAACAAAPCSPPHLRGCAARLCAFRHPQPVPLLHQGSESVARLVRAAAARAAALNAPRRAGPQRR